MRFNSLKTELFRKKNLTVRARSLVQWGPGEEQLLGCALQEVEEQQGAPSLLGTLSLRKHEREVDCIELGSRNTYMSYRRQVLGSTN